MITPSAFIQECQRRGIRLWVEGETLRAVGSPPPNPSAFTAYLKANKAPIREWLAQIREAEAAGPITRPIGQRGQVAPPARFASSGSADPYPGPEAPQGRLHAWALSEWERLRGESLDPALVEEALAAYADPGEGDGAEEPGEDTCVPAWLRACAPPPGWTQAEEAAHRRAWANERGAPLRRREGARHAPA